MCIKPCQQKKDIVGFSPFKKGKYIETDKLSGYQSYSNISGQLGLGLTFWSESFE